MSGKVWIIVITLSVIVAAVALVAGQKPIGVPRPPQPLSPLSNVTTVPVTVSPEPMTLSRYLDYSAQAFSAAPDKKRILYFHADWCPVCRPLDKEFSSMQEKIPEGVVVFKTNYDKESELKKTYGVTYQHTFVQVDATGKKITAWNGGGIEELGKRIR